jgi:hypothetical protein
MPNDLIVDYQTIYNTTQNQVNLNSAFGKPFVEVPGLDIENPVVLVGGASTTTTVGTTANGTNNTITVASASGISAGDRFVIGLGTANQQTVEVLSISSLVLTLTAPVTIDVLNGATVRECTLDGADVLMTARNNLIR